MASRQAPAAPISRPRRVFDESRFRLVPGSAGDHHSVYELLAPVSPGLSRDRFLTSLDDPFYEPTDRLLIKDDQRVAAHVHLTSRVMQFGTRQLACTGISGLVTSAAHRGQGFASRLLEQAERQMQADGAVLGLLKTRIPHFFRAAGWALYGRHCFARARTRAVLAQLVARAEVEQWSAAHIRPWRQVELPALMRLYSAHAGQSYGPFERTEAYWRWIISRKEFDQIFVALEGPDRQELDDQSSPIVGYVVLREDQVLELVAAGRQPQVTAAQLLARACSEAIERDLDSVVFHASPREPLLRLFQRAQGTWHHHEASQGEVYMVKLLDPMGFLSASCPLLFERAQQAELPRPCELGFDLNQQKFRLVVSRRSVRVCSGGLGRSYLRLNDADWTRLMLGHLDVEQAVRRGALKASTRVAQEIAQTLFPQLPLWFPPLDELAE